MLDAGLKAPREGGLPREQGVGAPRRAHAVAAQGSLQRSLAAARGRRRVAEQAIRAAEPEVHLRAQLGTASLVRPDGSRRVLLHIPRWDDAWQNYYVLRQPERVAKGSILEYLASYDNSPANPLNPDPMKPVPWGQQVWDEMHSVYMTWTAVTEHNVHDDEPIQIPAGEHNAAYLKTKRDKLGHLLDDDQ